MTLRTIFIELLHDRTVQAGTGSSATSLAGASWMDRSTHWAQPEFWTGLQPYLAAFAAFFGGLSALATFVYVVLKIIRLLRHIDSSS